MDVCLQPRPLINKPPSLNRDYSRDPNTKAVKRRGFTNHGSTSGGSVLEDYGVSLPAHYGSILFSGGLEQFFWQTRFRSSKRDWACIYIRAGPDSSKLPLTHMNHPVPCQPKALPTSAMSCTLNS